MTNKSQVFDLKTRNAYILTRILDTPFWGLFNLIPFILYKDLQASPFEIAIAVTLKPLSSILSSYWSTRAYHSSQALVPSLIKARCLAFLPFLALPFIHTSWFLIACYGLFMLLQVGMMPAWMEILKQNLPRETRDRVFSWMQAFGYLGGGLLPFLIGWLLDGFNESWRFLFPLAASISLIAIFWQKDLQVKSALSPQQTSHAIIRPWKNAWQLLKRRKDFAKFQLGFAFLGCGLMLLQPTLPVFIVDKLHLSYTELGVAITLCKGIGFACSSYMWTRLLQKLNLFHFSAIISILAAGFPLLLILAQLEDSWLYAAFVLYGLTQAGNELSWNLSGPLFSKNEDSSLYSNVNIISVGIRGIFIPSLGALLLAAMGTQAVMLFSSALCLIGALRLTTYGNSESALAAPSQSST